ncbi:integrase, catalytic region [Shewanella pealeana ATCC 700345]|uniref:Integrase, catalytic region n=1 Tax=Shewanella pealeana (strain ATCC 700345 / ANG-SQ1) TaxID=398579 RepID=A8H6P9_SHEPA|nr:integrase, catalytic region [Shewanella pealeana ATCC 700345]
MRAYSEALFRTLKYRPEWPSSGFKNITEAREWVETFVTWYNTKHKHSKLNFVSPSERHAMQDKAILSKRKEVLEEARSRNPKRWPNGIRNCDVIGEVVLNPEKESETETRNAA